jgi:hypothetical protein
MAEKREERHNLIIVHSLDALCARDARKQKEVGVLITGTTIPYFL